VEKNLVTAMINLFGGLRFRHMDLIDIGGAQLLLYACADTLETLQLDATALRGEKFPSEGIRFSTYGITDRHSLRDYDLSRNTSLWKLQITALSLINALRSHRSTTTPSSLRAVISTIKSPAFSEVLVVRADCLATNTEYCDRCTHATTQATNVARIKTEGTKGLLQGQVAG
jgi:hypothetical protein